MILEVFFSAVVKVILGHASNLLTSLSLSIDFWWSEPSFRSLNQQQTAGTLNPFASLRVNSADSVGAALASCWCRVSSVALWAGVTAWSLTYNDDLTGLSMSDVLISHIDYAA